MKINLLIRQFFVTHEAGVPLLARFPNLATLPIYFLNLHTVEIWYNVNQALQ